MKKLTSLLLPLFIASPLVIADESIDDALAGFSDEPDNSFDSFESQPEKDSNFDVSGSFVVSTAYNLKEHRSSTGTDYEGLSKLRNRINLQIDTAINDNWSARVGVYGYYDAVYDINSYRNYSDEVTDELEYDLDTHEVYLQGKLNSQWDIKIGRQIASWGNADNLRVIDVLNPLDNIEPGLADIEDLRLPVGMIKADYYFSNYNVSLMVIPEIRFSRNPPLGSDFYYYNAFDSLSEEIDFDLSFPNLDDKEPQDFRHQNWAAALKGSFSGWDFSINLARYWDDQGYLDVPTINLNNLAQTDLDILQKISLAHDRVTMIGGSAQFATGSWIFKTEVAHLDEISFNEYKSITIPTVGDIDLPVGEKAFKRLDVLIGAEFFGLSNTTLSVEYARRTILNFEDSIGFNGIEEHEDEIALRATRSFMNERMDINLVSVIFNPTDEGSINRLDLSYEFQDGLNGKVGVLLYENGKNPPFNGFYDNDRIFAEIKWSF